MSSSGACAGACGGAGPQETWGRRRRAGRPEGAVRHLSMHGQRLHAACSSIDTVTAPIRGGS
eukprot:361329-Chlamydomonas_euryale.AAC.1